MLDFYFFILYDKNMFRKKTIKAYQDLLDAMPVAAQIRSAQNKVLASNEEGLNVFGAGEDPFLFLRGTKQKESLKTLENALLQHSAYEGQVIHHNLKWSVRLNPIHHNMLLTANSEAEALESEQTHNAQLALFQNIIQNINLPLYLIDITGEIIYVNPDFSELLASSYETLLGQNISAFINAENLTKAPFLNEEIHLTTPPFLNEEIHLTTPQGTCPFMLTQYRLMAGQNPLFCGTLKPVLTPQLGASSQTAPLPYARINVATGTVLHANALFLKNMNLELAPKTLEEIFSAESLTPLFNRFKKAHTRLDFEKPTEMTALNGNFYQIYPSWAAIDESEAHLYFIDITSSKQLETQAMQSHKMQAMGQLTGGIAHDFNNILTAIMGFTDLLLQQHPAPDSAFADLMHIKGNVQKAAGLVGQLLTFSRKTPTEQHLISVHDSFVDLTALLQRAVAPTCHLKMEYKRHLGYIKMDANQLTQVFLNFAVNAKDAMPKGGELHISLTKEEVKKARPCGPDTMPAGAYVKIMVADNGAGIPAEVLPHIFDPFFTTKKKSNQSGTGLGLSTVYGIIHSAGGFIKVDSVPNVGTTFTVYLPRFDEKDHTSPAPKTEIQNVFLPTPKAPILLTDDEEAIRMVTARALQTKGFEVIQAGSAEEALKELDKSHSFQLLITDMVMPQMNGEELIAKAKKILPNLPCLLMSGYSDSFEKHTDKAEKPFYFIAKPFALSDLLTTVKEILEK